MTRVDWFEVSFVAWLWLQSDDALLQEQSAYFIWETEERLNQLFKIGIFWKLRRTSEGTIRSRIWESDLKTMWWDTICRSGDKAKDTHVHTKPTWTWSSSFRDLPITLGGHHCTGAQQSANVMASNLSKSERMYFTQSIDNMMGSSLRGFHMLHDLMVTATR